MTIHERTRGFSVAELNRNLFWNIRPSGFCARQMRQEDAGRALIK